MLSFSHIVVADYFYSKLKRNKLNFELSKKSFFNGNVLPDKQRHQFNAHYYSESKADVEYYLDKVNNAKLGNNERSEALGIVCHFMCDYFCKYHSIETYKQNTGFNHFMYEAQLHIMLRFIQIKRTLFSISRAEERIFTGFDLSKMIRQNGDIQSLMEDYYDQQASLVSDLTYAFAAVRGVLVHTLGIQHVLFEDAVFKKSNHELSQYSPFVYDAGDI